jgi:hypothetical protein
MPIITSTKRTNAIRYKNTKQYPGHSGRARRHTSAPKGSGYEGDHQCDKSPIKQVYDSLQGLSGIQTNDPTDHSFLPVIASFTLSTALLTFSLTSPAV